MLGIEDELFGGGHLGVGHDDGLVPERAGRCAATRRCWPPSSAAAPARSATSSPRSRPSRTRSSARRRPACSSSRAARAPARPSSPCTAPRTCCTPTASRWRTRASSSSARTGCSCATSSGSCPSLGEAGVEQVVLADLVPGRALGAARRPAATPSSPPGSRATPACRRSSTRPSRDRERPLRDDLRVPFRTGLRAADRRRVGAHRQGRPAPLPPPQRRPALRRGRGVRGAGGVVARRAGHGRRASARRCATLPEVRAALERMWPVLTPAQLLHDLFGSPALLRLAGAGDARRTPRSSALHRPRAERVDDVRWTPADVALLDDAREVLGPAARQGRQGRRRRRDPHVRPHRRRRGPGPHADAAEDGGPPVAQRLADRRRRPRPGHRRAGARTAGTTCSPTCPTASRRGSSACRSATASRPRSWSSPIA